jgi:hypothetical protein
MGRFDAARRSIADCLDILDDFLPPTHPHLGRATAGSAWIELEGGAPRDAQARFERALEILAGSMAEDHPLVLDARSGHAAALRALDDEPAACAEWRQIAALDRGEQLQDAAREQLRGFLATCGYGPASCRATGGSRGDRRQPAAYSSGTEAGRYRTAENPTVVGLPRIRPARRPDATVPGAHRWTVGRASPPPAVRPHGSVS